MGGVAILIAHRFTFANVVSQIHMVASGCLTMLNFAKNPKGSRCGGTPAGIMNEIDTRLNSGCHVDQTHTDQFALPHVQEFPGKLKVTVEKRRKILLRGDFSKTPSTAFVHVLVVIVVDFKMSGGKCGTLKNDTHISVATKAAALAPGSTECR